MPFTVSHIAAVLPAGRFPLLRDPLILSAFVIGSMSPDVPYFVLLVSQADTYGWSASSHTWAGIFSLNVPVTLALVAVFWDAFTHEGGFGVMTVPLLQLPHLMGPLPAYRVLQYVSSVFGMAVVCWSLLRWYRITPASAEVPAGLGWRWQAAIAGGVVTAGALS